MNLLFSLFKIPYLNTIIAHEVNKHTGSASILLVSGLTCLGWLPDGSAEAVNGMSDIKIIGGCLIVIALRMLTQFHILPLLKRIPFFQTKLERLQYKLECVKVEQQIKDVGNADKQ
ncbi:hypothetical protein ACFX5K_01305 [Rickettsiales bacterium LUAb2]